MVGFRYCICSENKGVDQLQLPRRSVSLFRFRKFSHLINCRQELQAANGFPSKITSRHARHFRMEYAMQLMHVVSVSLKFVWLFVDC